METDQGVYCDKFGDESASRRPSANALDAVAGAAEMISEHSSFWYLGSPYSRYPHGLEAAYTAAVIARGRLIRAGVPVFSPVIHSHPVAFLCDIDPLDHSIWLSAERPMLDAACGLIILRLEGWKESIGLREERKLFAAAGKPEVMMEPDCRDILGIFVTDQTA
jgi:hypothetical protein